VGDERNLAQLGQSPIAPAGFSSNYDCITIEKGLFSTGNRTNRDQKMTERDETNNACVPLDKLVEPLTREETLLYVRDKCWQTFRSKLRGQPFGIRKESLLKWLETNDFDRASRVQVGNYLQILKQAGLLNANKSNLKSKHT
jgi:hypothetical protein